MSYELGIQPQRFWPKVQKTDGCWNWQASKNIKGYGVISSSITGRPIPKVAHKVSWCYHFGPIPDGLLVLHKCDNRACVNPEHLFLGTADDNSKDMVKKGRQCKGEKRPLAKLTDAKVKIILYAKNVGVDVLAAEFAVARDTIRRVLSGKRWKHVEIAA